MMIKNFNESAFSSRLDLAIEVVLYALLAFMPLAFGVVHAWSELVVIMAATVLMLMLALRFFIAGDRPVLSWVLVPVAIFVLVPIVQLLPLPATAMTILSPGTHQTKVELLSQLEAPSGAGATSVQNSSLPDSPMQISFYPYATWHGLRLVLAVGAVFFTVLQVFRDSTRIKRLLVCITIVGGFAAVLAILQVISGTDKIYWLIPVRGKAEAGPFVNHSNFGQFINLSIGAALAFIFVKLHELFTGKSFSVSQIADYLTSPAGRWFWLVAAMVVLSIASIFVSLTRGGMVAFLISAGFTTLILTTRRSLHGRGWIMAVVALGAFICVLYVGFDAVYDRLATLGDVDRAEGGRWQIVKDIAVEWTQFPVLGTGLGTHAVVYPMFDRSNITALAGHAENEYAQVIEEAGLVGLVSLIVFGTIVWFAYSRCVSTAKTPVCSAAYGLGFGLIAILIQSLSDFGQHLPANAILSAIFCALLVGLALRPKEQPAEVRRNYLASGMTAVLMVFLTLGMGWLVFAGGGALAAGNSEHYWREARSAAKFLEEADWQGTSQQYAGLLQDAAKASSLQPGSVEYRHWLNIYRWRSMSRFADTEGNLIIPAKAVADIRRLVTEFKDGIRVCPTFGPSWTVAGQLDYFVLGTTNDGSHMIRTGYKLAPCDATTCFVNGLLDVDEYGKQGQRKNGDAPGFGYFARAVELDGRFFTEAAGVYISQLARPDLAVHLAGDDVGRLSSVARILSGSDEHGALAAGARQKVFELLEKRANEPDVTAGTLAALAALYASEKRSDEAMDLYGRALNMDYGNLAWRMDMARLLEATGNFDEAIHYCKICLRLKPGYGPAKDMIERLATRTEKKI